jgi:hypothetical protein
VVLIVLLPPAPKDHHKSGKCMSWMEYGAENQASNEGKWHTDRGMINPLRDFIQALTITLVSSSPRSGEIQTRESGHGIVACREARIGFFLNDRLGERFQVCIANCVNFLEFQVGSHWVRFVRESVHTCYRIQHNCKHRRFKFCGQNIIS